MRIMIPLNLLRLIDDSKMDGGQQRYTPKIEQCGLFPKIEDSDNAARLTRTIKDWRIGAI